MKTYTKEKWKTLTDNIDFLNLYKKKKRLIAQLERRAKTVLKNI